MISMGISAKRVPVTLLIIVTLLTSNAVRAGADDKDGRSGDPDAAKLVTSDIDNFWRAYDHSTQGSRAEVLDREYLKIGSDGLKDFIYLRIRNAETLANVIDAHPAYYASIRESTMRVSSMRQKIKACFYALKYLYDDAVFPNVYFVVGVMNSGGTTSARGLLIGTEMYGRTPRMVESEMDDWHKQVLRPIDDLPYIVAHELIHFQQKYPVMLKSTLLEKSIAEGGADFIAELISGGNINQHLHEFGNKIEQQLWTEFKAEMNTDSFQKWLYNGSAIKDRPADLGYFMGYKISEAYYNRASNKKQAIKEILNIKDFGAFLEASGYESKFSK